MSYSLVFCWMYNYRCQFNFKIVTGELLSQKDGFVFSLGLSFLEKAYTKFQEIYFGRNFVNLPVSSNIDEVIRAVLNFLFSFFYKKILPATKSTKSTKKHQKHIKNK